MLNWMKKKEKTKHRIAEKRNDKLYEEKVQYYFNCILPLTKDFWQDQKVVELIGVDNWISSNNRLNKDLSRDEMVDVICRMANVAVKYSVVMHSIGNDINNFISANENIRSEYAQFMSNKKNCPEAFRYNEDKYLVQLLKESFDKHDSVVMSKEHVKALLEELSNLTDSELKKRINDCLEGQSMIGNSMAKMLCLSTTSALEFDYATAKLKELKMK